MYCEHCGAALNEASHFCANCGAPIAVSVKPAVPIENPKTAAMRTPILVFGILGLAFAWPYFFLWIPGFIFSIIAICKIGKYRAAGGQLTGKAKAGNILATIGLVFNSLWLSLIVAAGIAYGVYALIRHFA